MARNEKTGKKAAAAASKTLTGKAATSAKTAAASALTQAPDKPKKGKKK